MIEQKLLSAIYSDRAAFEELAKYLQEDDLSDMGAILYKKATAFYDTDPGADAVDKELVLSQIAREMPKQHPQFKQALTLFGDVSIPNLIAEYIALKKQQTGYRLATALTEGRGNASDLIDEYKIYDKGELANAPHIETIRSENVFDLVTRTTGSGLLPLYPAPLAHNLDGGVVRGSHIIVFGRPDGGKSLFSINASAEYCAAGYTTLYVGNEDPADQMVLRVVSRMSGMDKFDIIKNPARAEHLAKARGYDNFIFASLAPGTPRELRCLIEEYKPDVLIIDQLRNLNVFEGNKVLQLEKAALLGRQLAKEHSLVCYSVTQAGDSAEGKPVLGMGDVDFSNTGIPSQADLMVGIGSNEAMKMQAAIQISVCKNKVNGWYGNFTCRTNKATSTVYDD